MNSSVFVINLARSIDRRRDIEKNLKECEIDYQIITAIEGAALTEQEKKGHTREINYAITNGEIGCALSHIQIYRHIVENNIASALILEDDAYINKELKGIIESLELQLNEYDPYLIILTETMKYIKKSKTPLSNKHALHEVLEAAGAHGYFVNHKAAKALVDFLYPVWLVADKWNVVYEHGICNVLAVKPPVISKTHHEMNSTIRIYTQDEKNKIRTDKDKIWEQLKKKRSLSIRARVAKLKIINAFRSKIKG